MGNKLNIHFDRDFTVIPNQLFRDKRLTNKAKGIFCTIISVPEDWNFSIAGLAQICGDGERSIKSGIEELEKYGYLAWNRVTDEGKFYVEVNVFLPDSTPQHYSSTEQNVTWESADNKELTNKELTLIKKGDIKYCENEFSRSESVDNSRKRDFVFEAVCEVCGIDWRELTKSSRGAVGKAVKELKEVNATPEQVRERARVYHFLWPTIKLTPMGLAARWAECHPDNATHIMTQKQRDQHLREYEDEQFWKSFHEERKEITDGY